MASFRLRETAAMLPSEEFEPGQSGGVGTVAEFLRFQSPLRPRHQAEVGRSGRAMTAALPQEVRGVDTSRACLGALAASFRAKLPRRAVKSWLLSVACSNARVSQQPIRI